MRWFTSLSIRKKLILMIFVISLIVVSAVSAVRIAWDFQQARASLVVELSALTQLLGDRSSAALAFDDAALAEENLKPLQVMKHIEKACLYRIDGSIIAEYSRNLEVSLLCPDVKEIESFPQKIHDNFIHLATNIEQGLLPLGWVYLRSDLSLVESKLRDQVIFSFFALTVAALVAVLLAGWAQRLISEPIAEITKVAKDIEEQGEKNLRAKVISQDEIGKLANSFNQMLDALDERNEQLRRSQKMEALGKLTGGIAHDYNNMLGVVLGYTELLQMALADNNPKLAKYTDHIQHAAERGAKLTKKLLGFSRHMGGQAIMLSLNSTLADEQQMLEKTLTPRINLILDLEQNLWSVWLDDGDLEDALLNMCINAMHAIEDQGQLIIQTRNVVIDEHKARAIQVTPGEYVKMTLKDSGCGMDQEIQSKIFDPFYSTKGDMGTGLGLSQVYGFVKRSGGAINVYSEVGEGTQFSLYFPRYLGEDKKHETEQALLDEELYGDETILVVDDEKALLGLCETILTKYGYTVICASSATEALEILAEQNVDLLLSDVIMPEMDGYQLAAQVRNKYPDIKIQLASGFSDGRSANSVDENMRKNLIDKPYDSCVLLKRVRELLD